jgi:hypothetical protein
MAALTGFIDQLAAVAIENKNLLVVGEGFDDGAVIVMNGQPQRALHDPRNPTTRLIGKKLGAR